MFVFLQESAGTLDFTYPISQLFNCITVFLKESAGTLDFTNPMFNF